MKVIISVISSFLLLLFVSSCTKAPEGATGPAGPTGAAGAGASYDVFYDSISPTQSIANGWNGNDSVNGVNTDYYDHTFSISYLSIPTNNYTQPPIVEVYFSTDGGANYYSLPQLNVFAANDRLLYAFTNGSVTIIYQNSVTYPTETLYIKIIIIPVP